MLTASRSKPCNCLYCGELIATTEPAANKLRLGKHAHFHCYRVKRLFDAGNKWINENVQNHNM